MEIKGYLNQILTVFIEEMNENLVGVYLHGSLAMGCFNPDTSDVDLLVICETNIPNGTKIKMINRLLKITQYSCNQLEMSIILREYLNDFIYPTPFELHYFHPNYLTEENYICGGEGFSDPDLAGHLVITYHRGKVLYGEELKEVFKPIDKKYYIESIFNDIKYAPTEIMNNPIYFTLNLCRVLYFLKEATISSKKEGGEWGIKNLPNKYQVIVKQCLDAYTGTRKGVNIPHDELINFSTYMLSQCEKFR